MGSDWSRPPESSSVCEDPLSESALKVASRGSPLALAQAATVAALLEATFAGLHAEIVVVETTGDRRVDVPLHEIGGQGVFAKEVQLAVLDGRADIAVHSAKDLPSATPEGLVLAAVPERLDPADVLVGRSLAGLGPGAVVATGSPRRRVLLSSLRPDLTFTELRGNMKSRLDTPGRDGVDAVVTAQAALERLGLASRAAERLDPFVVTPQVAQGAIGVEAREGSDAAGLLGAIDDRSVHDCVSAERSFLATLGAGCTAPVGAWCRAVADGFEIDGVLFDESSGQLLRASRRGHDPVELGRLVAEQLQASAADA